MPKVDPKQQKGMRRTLVDGLAPPALPRRIANEMCSRYLRRSTSSFSTQYQAACTTDSESDFICKLKLMAADWGETLQVLELLAELNPEFAEKIGALQREGNELFLTIASSVDLL